MKEAETQALNISVFDIVDEHKNQFNRKIISTDKRFQYYCTKCEHISYKYCL
jgi:hypothetical protein